MGKIKLTDIVVQCINDTLEKLTDTHALYIRVEIAQSQQLHILAQKNEHGNIRTGYVQTQSEAIPSRFTEQGVHSPDIWEKAGITFLHGVSGVITYHEIKPVRRLEIVEDYTDRRVSKICVEW